jgi:DNA repair protein RadC
MSGLHDERGQCLKKRFIECGLRDFAEHEVLELALFYTQPRVNTSEIAHRLLKQFGCLRDICSASVDELIGIDGLGRESAVFLRFLGEFVEIYDKIAPLEKKKAMIRHDVGRYFVSTIGRCSRETVAVMYLSGDGDFLEAEEVSRGSEFAAQVPVRKILERAFAIHADAVVIAHNHPTGLPEPSEEDYSLTVELQFIFGRAGIKLADHFIVAGGEYFSMSGRFGLNRFKVSGVGSP